MKLKQLALTASVGAGLLAASLPSQAIIVGAAGEAYLIPLVIYQSNGPGKVNTLIQITVPGSMGEETIPNDFTALNVGAYNCEKDAAGVCLEPPSLFPSTVDVTDEDPVDENYIHWAFFDEESKHVCNNEEPITPDDFAGINWGKLVENGNCNAVDGRDVDGLKGYMVLSNLSSYRNNNAEPQFAFFADAYLVTNGDDGLSPQWGTVAAKIPTLPMSDGPDATPCVPTPADSVCYSGDQIDASPLIAGMRTNRSDGVRSTVYWDLTLSTRTQPTMHVVWMDRNFVGNRVYDDPSQEGQEVPIKISRSAVFDSHEESCSGPAPKLTELTTIWIEPLCNDDPSACSSQPKPSWATYTVKACDPVLPNDDNRASPFATQDVPGFILYGMEEPVDNDIDAPESAGVAFAIQFNTVIDDVTPNVIPVETAFGHERGLFAE
jgi:hypothetical protein